VLFNQGITPLTAVMQQLRKVQLALALLLAITVSGTADASSLRSRYVLGARHSHACTDATMMIHETLVGRIFAIVMVLAVYLLFTVSLVLFVSVSRLYGKDAVVLGTIEAEMVDLYASRQSPSLSAPSSMESSSGSSSGMDSDPSPPPQQGVSRSVQGSQVQVHKQSYQQLKNKRGGKMYVISNRNSLMHEGLLDPKV